MQTRCSESTQKHKKRLPARPACSLSPNLPNDLASDGMSETRSLAKRAEQIGSRSGLLSASHTYSVIWLRTTPNCRAELPYCRKHECGDIPRTW